MHLLPWLYGMRDGIQMLFTFRLSDRSDWAKAMISFGRPLSAETPYLNWWILFMIDLYADELFSFLFFFFIVQKVVLANWRGKRLVDKHERFLAEANVQVNQRTTAKT